MKKLLLALLLVSLSVGCHVTPRRERKEKAVEGAIPVEVLISDMGAYAGTLCDRGHRLYFYTNHRGVGLVVIPNEPTCRETAP